MKTHLNATTMVVLTMICSLAAAMATGATTEAFLSGEIQSLSFSQSVPGQLSYQGSLHNSSDGTPVDGTFAVVFRLFDDKTSGTEQWSETHPSVEVDDGHFHVLLGSVASFQGGLFDGSELWLQMEIGSEIFSPRLPLASVAYSFRANSAEKLMDYTFSDLDSLWARHADLYHLDAADGNPADAVYVDTEGKVGIGTSIPFRQLHVAGDMQATTYYGDGSNLTGITTSADSAWIISGNDMYSGVPGDVGVGTDSPSAKLEVIGTVDADAFTINGTPVGTSTDSYWNLNQSDIAFPSGNVGVGTSSPDARFQVVEGRGHDVQICGTDFALYAAHSGGNYSYLGDNEYAVYGQNSNANWGFFGSDLYGAFGQHASGNHGYIGGSAGGVYGKNLMNNTEGILGSDGHGVYGSDQNGNFGFLAGFHEFDSYGVYGQDSSGNEGGLGTDLAGVYGYSENYWGVNGYTESETGVRGQNWTSHTEGGLGSPEYGAYGTAAGDSVFGFLAGSVGGSWYGVYGRYGQGQSTEGALGTYDYGVYGEGHADSVYGFLGGKLVGEVPCGAYGQINLWTYGALGIENTGVYGFCDDGLGVQGQTRYGAGVSGENTETLTVGELGGQTSAVYGYTRNKAWGSGGIASADAGVFGTSGNNHEGALATNNYGAYGEHSNSNWGALGHVNQGAYGEHNNGNYGLLGGSFMGAYGSNAAGHYGSLGDANYGVYGRNNNGNYGYFGSSNFGVRGIHNNGNAGSLGSGLYGTYGYHNSGTYGYIGSSGIAVRGYNNNGNHGNIGDSNNGVFGQHANGNKGFVGSIEYGVWGENSNGNLGGLGEVDFGVFATHASLQNAAGLADSGAAVFGADFSGGWGTIGTSAEGVYGEGTLECVGVLGQGENGAGGEHYNGNMGVLGNSAYGAYGRCESSQNYGYLGHDTHGVYGAHNNGNNGHLGGPSAAVKGNAFSGYAGHFVGDVYVSNHFSKGTGSFKIDHPLDPENMFLYHSFVESPDMMNVYNGNVVLDADGTARVELPEWFEVLNKDFRYQLTCIGGFAPVYIEEKISGNSFRIAGGESGLTVSWQVTGIRQDPLANAERVPVEEEKSFEERGYYLHPEAYGYAREQGIDWLTQTPQERGTVEPLKTRLVRHDRSKQLQALQAKVVQRALQEVNTEQRKAPELEEPSQREEKKREAAEPRVGPQGKRN